LHPLFRSVGVCSVIEVYVDTLAYFSIVGISWMEG